jgi:hypothetical protein
MLKRADLVAMLPLLCGRTLGSWCRPLEPVSER